MTHWNSLIMSVLATALLVACGTPPERHLSTQPAVYAALPNGHDPLNPDVLAASFGSLSGGGDESPTRALERKKGRALNIISLSGGGQNGAFGAGFLVGWRESGSRPVFDGVGGVSTGALLATHAFLGTPADDALLEQMYTQIDRENIYTDIGLLSILSGTDSLKNTTPLRNLIAKYITADTLRRVAVASAEDRVLVVGTTNVDYGQTWLWNMSLIAKAGDLDLYRKVLLASASFPIVFPPVEIHGHLFVDGAARSNLVVVGMSGREKPSPPLYGPGNLYVISNGKLQHPPQALRRALGDIAATTVAVMMDQSMQTAVARSYFGARLLGYEFNLVVIPDDVDVGKDPLAFDPKKMRAAFDAGRALAGQPDPWSHVPPDTGDLPTWALKSIREIP